MKEFNFKTDDPSVAYAWGCFIKSLIEKHFPDVKCRHDFDGFEKNLLTITIDDPNGDEDKIMQKILPRLTT